MKNQLIALLTGIALATGMISASATSASVATIPAGMISYSLNAGTTTMLSLPLTNTETYTSTVAAVTSNTISVADSPAPFTTNLALPATPYFVKFLSGNEAGRVVLITGNTTSVLTLDTTDHATGTPVLLNTTGFAVAAGDSFEIFPGDTLASIFGAGGTQNPMILTGTTGIIGADTVTLFTSGNALAVSYYYNSDDNCWETADSSQSQNNAIIYPYSAFAVNIQSSHAKANLIVGGRVTAVAANTKVVSNGTIYTSTHYATDVTLSQLQFGSHWVTGTSVFTADTLSVWNPTSNQFDTYYQKPDQTWRKFPDANTDQSNFSIAAGTVTAIAKKEVVSGSSTFLQTPLPYSLD